MNKPVNIKLSSTLGKLVRRTIYTFFCEKEEYYHDDGIPSILNTITKITIDKTNLHYVISIETYRPGLIIGKRGTVLDNLIKLLDSKVFTTLKDAGITFEINLSECKLWNNIHM